MRSSINSTVKEKEIVMATESQKKASRKWEKRNPEQARTGSYKRTARLFVRQYATQEDIAELIELIEERKKEIEK